jgi:hypothetical protein
MAANPWPWHGCPPRADTPAERLLTLLANLLEGRVPAPKTVASLMAALSSQQDLYRPSDLDLRIQQAAGMDVSGASPCLQRKAAQLLLTGAGAGWLPGDGRIPALLRKCRAEVRGLAWLGQLANGA